jgi:hypothetical protein
VDEAGDLFWRGPLLGGRNNVVFEFAQVGIKAFAQLGLVQAAKTLDFCDFFRPIPVLKK